MPVFPNTVITDLLLPTDFDEDDPLAGLGLSDDEDILSKPKPKKPELTKRLSGANKGKVDPNIATSDAQSQNSTPVRCK